MNNESLLNRFYWVVKKFFQRKIQKKVFAMALKNGKLLNKIKKGIFIWSLKLSFSMHEWNLVRIFNGNWDSYEKSARTNDSDATALRIIGRAKGRKRRILLLFFPFVFWPELTRSLVFCFTAKCLISSLIFSSEKTSE